MAQHDFNLLLPQPLLQKLLLDFGKHVIQEALLYAQLIFTCLQPDFAQLRQIDIVDAGARNSSC